MKDMLKTMLASNEEPALTEVEIDSIVERAGTNLNLGCAIGWEIKAAKAASMISFSADGATYNRNEFIANAERMALMYRKRLNTTIRVGDVVNDISQ